MAGLGEACTHIGAVLFYMETATKISKETSCTQQKCQWTIPSFQKNIPYLPVKHLIHPYLNVLVLLLYYVYCYYYNVQHNLLLIIF